MNKYKQKQPKSLSSGGIVWQKNKKGELEILLLHRFKSDRWEYESWHLPKGTMESGETKKETARREICEETGYEVRVGRKIGFLKSTWDYKGTTILKTTYYFICRPIKKVSSKINEHDEIKWVKIDEAIQKTKEFPIFEKEGIILKKFKQVLSS